ncbi:RHS repeat-associated core domain-containing protein, partial [Streptomyces seoulensis]
QPFGYTGAYLDSSGLYKMGARYNDPTLGRFTQPDPSGQETNPYLYAAGDPTNNIDPTGLSFFSEVRKIGFASVSGAVGGFITGGIAGCIAGAEIGCLPSALLGAFGGAVGGAATKGYLEYEGQ